MRCSTVHIVSCPWPTSMRCVAVVCDMASSMSERTQRLAAKEVGLPLVVDHFPWRSAVIVTAQRMKQCGVRRRACASTATCNARHTHTRCSNSDRPPEIRRLRTLRVAAGYAHGWERRCVPSCVPLLAPGCWHWVSSHDNRQRNARGTNAT